MRIFITGDIDLANDEIISDYIGLFEKFECSVTLFATHCSTLLQELDSPFIDIGIHPNHYPSLCNGEGQASRVLIKELLKFYPESIGIRSHSLTISSGLINTYKELGLKYESNYLLPFMYNVHPWKCYSGMTRVPINWEDDVSWLYGFKKFNQNTFYERGFYSFNFHPFHI